MSRAKKSEILSRNPLLEKRHDADVKRLAFLGNLIKKDTPLNEFSKKLGYPPSTISRFLSGNNRSASSDELIVSLAVNRPADCGVSFRNLINAQGYYMVNDERWDVDELLENYFNLFITVSNDYTYSLAANRLSKNDALLKAENIMLKFFIDNGYSTKSLSLVSEKTDHIIMWSMHDSFQADMIIGTDCLENWGLKKWAFIFCCDSNMSTIESKYLRLFASSYLGHPADHGYRISFVVNECKIYQRLRMSMQSWEEHGIQDSISLILIDFNNDSVVAEHVMPRLGYSDNAEEPCVYDETIIGDKISEDTREFISKCDYDDFAVNELTDGDLIARYNIPMCDEDDNQTKYIEPEGCQNKGEF